jgi:hypothetical protein
MQGYISILQYSSGKLNLYENGLAGESYTSREWLLFKKAIERKFRFGIMEFYVFKGMVHRFEFGYKWYGWIDHNKEKNR